MKDKNIWLLAVSSLILVFDIAMAFVLNAYSVKIEGSDRILLYVLAKCAAVLALIAIAAYGFFKKDAANYIIQYIATLVLQFVPLIVRYASDSNGGFIASVVVFFVALIIYCALLLGLHILSKRTAAASKKLEGEKIPVKNDKEN